MVLKLLEISAWSFAVDHPTGFEGNRCFIEDGVKSIERYILALTPGFMKNVVSVQFAFFPVSCVQFSNGGLLEEVFCAFSLDKGANAVWGGEFRYARVFAGGVDDRSQEPKQRATQIKGCPTRELKGNTAIQDFKDFVV